MNPETSLSNQQITEIFKQHKLAQNPKIARINVGFTNEVHQVDDYILKVCVRPSFEAKFKNEARLYKKLQGKALVPELVVADDSRTLINKPYMIYKKIPGQPLGYRWHLLNNAQRHQIIKDFCAQLKIVNTLEPNPKLTPGPTWLDNNSKAFKGDLEVIERKKLLPPSKQKAVKAYIAANQHVLTAENLAFSYWDPHLDNIIVDDAGKMAGIIDFEHVGVISIDFILSMVKQIQEYPWLTLSLEMEKYADKKDYRHLMAWYKEFYPELFDFPNLEKRLDLYELQSILHQLASFPKAKQLHNRLNRILGQS